MVYYLIFIFLAALSIFNKVKLPKDLTLLIFLFVNIILILFAGLRGNIEPDYSNYHDIFNFSRLKYSIDSGVEYGYYLMNKVILTLGLSFQVVIFTMAVLSIGSKVLFFQKYSPNLGLSVLIYYSSMFFLFDFIAIRQALALSIFMFSIPFISKRKFLPFLILMLLASQVHISALLLIPGYFLFNRKFSEKVLFAILIVCSIINILKIEVPLIQLLFSVFPIPGASADKISIYLQENEYAFVSLKQMFLAFVFVYIKLKIKVKDEMFNTLLNIFIIGIVFATLFNGLPQLSYRLKWYFFFTEAILIVYVVDYFSKDRLGLTYCLYGLLFIVYGYSMFTLLGEIASRDSYIYPYKFFFSKF